MKRALLAAAMVALLSSPADADAESEALQGAEVLQALPSPAGADAESDALQGAELLQSLLKDKDFAERLRVAGIFQACWLLVPDKLLLPLIPAAERRLPEMFPEADTDRVLMVVFAMVSGFQTGMAEGIAAGFRACSNRELTCKLASERAAELLLRR